MRCWLRSRGLVVLLIGVNLLAGCASDGSDLVGAPQPSATEVPVETAPAAAPSAASTAPPLPTAPTEAVETIQDRTRVQVGDFEYRLVFRETTGHLFPRDYFELVVVDTDGVERGAFVEVDPLLGYVPLGAVTEILAVGERDLLIRTTFNESSVVLQFIARIGPDGLLVDPRGAGGLYNADELQCGYAPIEDAFCLAQVISGIQKYDGVDPSQLDPEVLYVPAPGYPHASWTWHQLIAPDPHRCDESTIVARGTAGVSFVFEAPGVNLEAVGVVENLVATNSTYNGLGGDTDARFLVVHTECRPGSTRDEFRIAAAVTGTIDGGPSSGESPRWLSAPFDMSLDAPTPLTSINKVTLHIAATSDLQDPCPFVLEIEATDESSNPVRFYTYYGEAAEAADPPIWKISTEHPTRTSTDCL